MRRINGGWVFDPAEEGKVLATERDEVAMLKAAKHVRECCLSGHSCGKGDRCRGRCGPCAADAMAAWDGKKRRLSREADRLLEIADGIPVTPPKVSPSPSVEEVCAVVVAVLQAMGYTFK